MKPTPAQLMRLADELWDVIRQVWWTSPQFWGNLPEDQKMAYSFMTLAQKRQFWAEAMPILARFPA